MLACIKMYARVFNFFLIIDSKERRMEGESKGEKY